MAKQPNADQPRILLTVEQAARQLSISRTTMFRLLRAGRVDSVRIGHARRIPAEALDTYVNGLAAEQQAA